MTQSCFSRRESKAPYENILLLEFNIPVTTSAGAPDKMLSKFLHEAKYAVCILLSVIAAAPRSFYSGGTALTRPLALSEQSRLLGLALPLRGYESPRLRCDVRRDGVRY